MKKKFVIAGSFLLSIIVLQSCGNNSSSTTDTTTDTSVAKTNEGMTKKSMETSDLMNNELMEAMHKSMMEIKMTGDFDVDFANTMIQHHQEAIDMSEVELAKGNDPQVKSWAQNIITAQKKEIDQLQQIVKNHKSSGKEMEGNHNELKGSMDKMMNDMMAMKMTGNIDKDFITMMIMHHESAVTMAKAELSKGENAGLKKMAQKIIEDQSAEIKEFKNWLDKNK